MILETITTGNSSYCICKMLPSLFICRAGILERTGTRRLRDSPATHLRHHRHLTAHLRPALELVSSGTLLRCSREPQNKTLPQAMNHTKQIEFLKFIIVGMINTMVTLVVIFTTKSLLGLNPYLSNALGYVAGLTNSFIWNKAWVFRSKGSTGAEGQSSPSTRSSNIPAQKEIGRAHV